MNKQNKYSSSIKVGLLTLAAISIFIFTVLWIKGRSLSAGERINIAFNDVNGMRAGSAVQMMGLRIGQIEEVTPVINGKDSFVNIRFVVTEKGVKIPYASTISIQQSGIIGEQFLEVTPPKTKTIYSQAKGNAALIEENHPIYMKLSTGEVEVGKILDYEIVKDMQVPANIRKSVKSKNILKLKYIIDLPGLILDEEGLKFKIENNKPYLYFEDGEIPQTPKSGLKYTVIEPMRLSDFMDLQFRAAKSLAETNNKIGEILSDEFIGSLKSSVDNIRILTKNANTTLDKAAMLIDSSKEELESLVNQSEKLITSLTTLSDNINSIVSDEKVQNDVLGAIRSVGKMSENVNKIIEDKQTKEILENLDLTMKNVAEITAYVDEYTKNEQLKEDLISTMNNLSKISENIAKVMNDYNKLDEKDKMKLKNTVKSINTTVKNVEKFSEKLNKRFLLFRLMF